jgi:hypothetical protein
MRTEFEGWQKQMTAAYKKAEVPSRIVLQTVMGDLFEYVTVTPLAKFADMDGPSPLERAVGKDEAATVLRKGGMYITSVRRIASLAINDLSIQTPMPAPAPYYVVTSMRLVPGKGPEFTAWMKDEYMPAMKKAELKNFWVSQSVFGGNPNERITVRPMKALGEIDAGPLATKALGAEGASKMMSHSAGVVESVQFSIVRFRPELSYELPSPAPPKAAAAR